MFYAQFLDQILYMNFNTSKYWKKCILCTGIQIPMQQNDKLVFLKQLQNYILSIAVNCLPNFEDLTHLYWHLKASKCHQYLRLHQISAAYLTNFNSNYKTMHILHLSDVITCNDSII